MSHFYRHTTGSHSVRLPLHGARLSNVTPLSPDLYDREETGPMFTAEAEGFDGVLHLFGEEITSDVDNLVTLDTDSVQLEEIERLLGYAEIHGVGDSFWANDAVALMRSFLPDWSAYKTP